VSTVKACSSPTPNDWPTGRTDFRYGPAAFGYRADVASDDRPLAAEEARTIVASNTTGTLATLGASGDPWASFVTYGLLAGAPVLCLSTLAEHGRNLLADPRASIAIVSPSSDPNPQSWGRVTLAGAVERPVGGAGGAARDA
jgi:heme iron utilization protein